MLNILLHIVAWVFLVLSFFGLIVFFVAILYITFSKKGVGPLPWWMFWRP